MTPFISVYLDALRILAALSVLVYHWGTNVGPNWAAAGWHGHDSVIVFFVLSGFVMSHAAVRADSLRAYAFARATRVYSVAIPALLLALLAAPLAEMYPGRTSEPTLRTVFLNLTFLNWSWTNSLIAPNIGVWWSLSYEVWYYALFGVLTFLRGRWRILWVVFFALCTGPKVLLLAPAWWCGVLAYRYWRHVRFPALLAFGSVVLFLLAKVIGTRELVSGAPLLGPLWREEARVPVLGFSAWFTWDYIVAGLTALHIAGVAKIRETAPPPGLTKAIRWAAGATFSLYLTHLVFLRIADSFMGGPAIIALILAIIGALVFAELFERRLKSWRRLASRMLGGSSSLARAGFSKLGDR